MITVWLPNSDAQAIEFAGSLLFSGSVDPDVRRHLKLVIYESRTATEIGRRRRMAHEVVRYAFSVTYSSSWDHERTHHLSSTADDLASLEKQLRALDPTRWVVGYSYVNDEDRQRRQEAMLRDVRERWSGLVATAIAHAQGEP
jgi:uncharacterized protein YktB (UPF0637 family)